MKSLVIISQEPQVLGDYSLYSVLAEDLRQLTIKMSSKQSFSLPETRIHEVEVLVRHLADVVATVECMY